MALAGGAAFFLGGAAALRRAFRIGPIAARVVGAVLALPTILLATEVAPRRSSSPLVVLLTAVLTVESWRGPDPTHHA